MTECWGCEEEDSQQSEDRTEDRTKSQISHDSHELLGLITWFGHRQCLLMGGDGIEPPTSWV